MLDPVITSSDDLPVSLAFAKAHAVVDFCDDDALLDQYIRAAVSYLDGPTGALGRAMMPQSVTQSLCAISERMGLPYGPASSVAAVEYYDADNVLQTLSGWSLLSDAGGSFIYFGGDIPTVYDRPDAVTVTYSAGYPSVADIPHTLQLAMVQLVSGWYETRESASEKSYSHVPFAVRSLIEPHRRVSN